MPQLFGRYRCAAQATYLMSAAMKLASICSKHIKVSSLHTATVMKANKTASRMYWPESSLNDPLRQTLHPGGLDLILQQPRLVQRMPFSGRSKEPKRHAARVMSPYPCCMLSTNAMSGHAICTSMPLQGKQKPTKS